MEGAEIEFGDGVAGTRCQSKTAMLICDQSNLEWRMSIRPSIQNRLRGPGWKLSQQTLPRNMCVLCNSD